ncbi:hypothetical protein CRE_22601 [Caenorhabditis remanei]|uniref:F-box domain-containing protein n=1 Tax=Caenorhabditis remanei TaxID=31234 RepID=E3N3B3_CAERE|nr:hypothetical protein CRE_22601 [Caenorhabditis remanei]
MTKFTGFPILKLPILCFEKILGQCEPFDQINISFLSKKCAWLLKSLRNKQLMCFDIELKNDYTKLAFILEANEIYGSWMFNFGEPRDWDWRFIQVTKDDMFIDNVKRLKYWPFLSVDPQQTLNSSVSYLTNLFDINVRNVLIAPDDFPETRTSIFPGFDCHFYCDPINFKKGEILFGNTSTGWITRDILFKFKNSRIQLYGCNTRNLNANDFDRFVDRWYRSDDTEFELLMINWKQYPGSLNISKFKPFAWNENRRSQNFRLLNTVALDCSQGYDILRHDGALATILTNRVNSLVFYVWNVRFPDTTGLEVQ